MVYYNINGPLGAKTAVEASMMKSCGQPEAIEEGGLDQDNPDQAETEMETDPWEDWMPSTPANDIRKKRKVVTSLEARARMLRKCIGWVEAELQRVEAPGRGPRTQRQKRRRRLLQKRLGLRRMTGRTLRMQGEKLKGLLRVKALQIREKRETEKKVRAECALADWGPGRLGEPGTERQTVTKAQAEEVGKFWGGIWGQEGTYHPNHQALAAWKAKLKKDREDRGEEPEVMDRNEAWAKAVAKQPSWKAPGPDAIPAFWYKVFKAPTALLRDMIWELVDGPDGVPSWFVRGRTVMLPKEGCEGRPEQFRPITCLNTGYKLLTGALAAMLMKFVNDIEMLPEEQRAMRKGVRGCLDALAVDEAVAWEAKIWRKNLSVGWIDYQKAFDMTPHLWIKDLLKAARAPKLVRRALRKLMPEWVTDIELKSTDGTIRIPVGFKRGLYQGDTLSPLLFCLAVAPLSHALNSGGGFRSDFQQKPVTHMMFMDDVKLYEQSKAELEATMQVTESVSEAVGMSLGVRKCAVAHMRAGRVRRGGDVDTLRAGRIGEITGGGTYRYLGIEQVFGKKSVETRKKVSNEYLRRVRKTWNSSLKSRSKAVMHNSWCVGALRYFGATVDWGESGASKLDTATRRILKACKAHHKGSAVERLYIPRKEGGRGLQSVEHVVERETVSAALYLVGSKDRQVQGAVRLQRELEAMGETPLITRAKEVLEGYGVALGALEPEETGQARMPAATLKELDRRQKEKLHERQLIHKKMHGRQARLRASPGVDTEATNRWLSEGKLNAETEMIAIAAQDGVTHTRWYRNKFVKRGPTECRVCGTDVETIEHILGFCDGYLWGLYKERHDRILYLLVKAVMKSLGLTIPRAMSASGGVAAAGVWGPKGKQILVDQLIPTKRLIKERKPDLIVKLAEEKRVAIMEVACATEIVVERREQQKLQKYQELAADMAKQMPGYTIRVTPVVIGNLGLIRGLKEYLTKSQVMTDAAVHEFMGHAQREAICAAVKTIKRHMKA